MFRSAQHDKARSVEPPRIINIEDLRCAAKRRLPRVVFDYIDGGAEDEWTLRANCRAFEASDIPATLRSCDAGVRSARVCPRRISVHAAHPRTCGQ